MRICALVLCAAACQSPSPDRKTSVAIAVDGAASYQALCSPCHGVEANGYKADHAPSLINPTFLESASDDFVRRSIIYGRPGTSMAAYGKELGGPLDALGVERIVTWLRGHGSKPIAMLGGGLAGDATRGAPLYAKDCQTCHGDATTRGEGVHLANSRFLSFATDAFIRWAIVHGRPGTKMDAWQGKLGDREIDDIVAYVRAFAAPLPPVQKLDQLPRPTGNEPLVINPNGANPTFDLRADPCPPQQLGQPACVPDPRFVSADQVKLALDAKRKLVIIDARPPSDWMSVHVTGAVSISYFDMKRLAEIPNDGTWVIAYCACPHHLSGLVVDELRKRGYKHAVVLDEGILEWHRRGFPVVAAPGVTPPPKQLAPR